MVSDSQEPSEAVTAVRKLKADVAQYLDEHFGNDRIARAAYLNEVQYAIEELIDAQ